MNPLEIVEDPHVRPHAGHRGDDNRGRDRVGAVYTPRDAVDRDVDAATEGGVVRHETKAVWDITERADRVEKPDVRPATRARSGQDPTVKELVGADDQAF